MPHVEVEVTYSVIDTVDNAKFTCERSSLTMTPHSTIIKFVEGRSWDGRKVKDAAYRDAYVVIRYDVD